MSIVGSLISIVIVMCVENIYRILCIKCQNLNKIIKYFLQTSSNECLDNIYIFMSFKDPYSCSKVTKVKTIFFKKA